MKETLIPNILTTEGKGVFEFKTTIRAYKAPKFQMYNKASKNSEKNFIIQNYQKTKEHLHKWIRV